MTEPGRRQTTSQTDPAKPHRPKLLGKLPDLRAQLVFWSLLLAGLLFDLWSKKAVFERLEYSHGIIVIDGLINLVPVLNNGAAFGICAGQPLFLSLASVAGIVVVFGYFYLSGLRDTLIQAALGLVAAGICGNLYDRLFNAGCVRDFIDVYINAFGREWHWHTFNVADVLLCVGVGLLVIRTTFTAKSAQKRAPQRK